MDRGSSTPRQIEWNHDLKILCQPTPPRIPDHRRSKVTPESFAAHARGAGFGESVQGAAGHQRTSLGATLSSHSAASTAPLESWEYRSHRGKPASAYRP